MVCVTYGDYEGVSNKVTDKDLSELLREVRTFSGIGWELEEYTIVRRRLFRSPVTEKRYTLYCPCGPEWQIINHVGDSNYSINHTVTKAQVGSLLVGYRIGFYDALRKPTNTAEKE